MTFNESSFILLECVQSKARYDYKRKPLWFETLGRNSEVHRVGDVDISKVAGHKWNLSIKTKCLYSYTWANSIIIFVNSSLLYIFREKGCICLCDDYFCILR